MAISIYMCTTFGYLLKGEDFKCISRTKGIFLLIKFMENKSLFCFKRPYLNNAMLHYPSGNVRKYYDVKNRTFLQNFMRDFCHFYAQFLFFNNSKYVTLSAKTSLMLGVHKAGFRREGHIYQMRKSRI